MIQGNLNERTPVVWHGIPDLRDKSHDLELWGKMPIPCWHVTALYEMTKIQTWRMVRQGDVETCKMFGKTAIRLGSLSQTVRCHYIESIFREKVGIDNVLYRGGFLCKLMGINPRGLQMLWRQGMIVREFTPSGGSRYPHWGLDRDIKKYVTDYLLQEREKKNSLAEDLEVTKVDQDSL